MTETEALGRMVAPGQKRKGKWRGGIVQVHVTRACDRACFHCTQGSNLGGKPVIISVPDFEVALKSLKGYWGVVGIFGGNPALHPQFAELMEVYRRYVPFAQRGLWCNHPRGKGSVLAETFNPAVSNLNVHEDEEAHREFLRDWPASRPFLKGLDSDSRHSAPFVAMRDVVPDEGKRWDLISDCDINKHWSAMVCYVPGRGVRAFFCELAGAQAMLHAGEADYPDTGVRINPDGTCQYDGADGTTIHSRVAWWELGMGAFKHQVRKHCHDCGIPLRRFGQLANGGDYEEVSATHSDIYKPKQKGRRVELVTLDNADCKTIGRVTDYLENGGVK